MMGVEKIIGGEVRRSKVTGSRENKGRVNYHKKGK